MIQRTVRVAVSMAFVGLFVTRNSAERIARDTPGVRSVDNNVRFGD